ncbi:hypothetical protein [Kitasatospora sp. NPDC057223]|uniref:hypothetical protein n=1 Tax=Kitasatospora sp. NPDC057223 TaxID=3346055 RepID=UPI00363D0053
MGWASASYIFDPVAQALIDSGATDELKTRVLADLIRTLKDGDWDTEHESLDQFAGDAAIVEAFRQHGVVIQCDADTDDSSCELETGHAGDHRDWQGKTWRQEDNPVREHAEVLQPHDVRLPGTRQWQVHCPRCAEPSIDRGTINEDGTLSQGGDHEAVTVHPDRDNYDGPIETRGGYVEVALYCGAGHAFQLIVANHKGAEYVAVVS